MSFFRNLKWFVEDLHDANKELAQGVRNDLKEFKTDMKDLTKRYHPKTGEAIEKIDRAAQAIKNAKRSLPYPYNREPQISFSRIEEMSPEKLQRGDHIYVQRFGYEHHALYIGNNQIIHYSNGSIRRDELEAMDNALNQSDVRVKNSPCLYDLDLVVSRAESRIGESDYNLALNNCEHFVTWCRSGGKYSDSI
ncbi:lecithin retinol acyltransferase family protein [Brevibacillus sp. TJ4]|uniref:lecithin retinol acyltransferase family protein n=1 Tax=Brevibacillus sp. TJ4 TaxID=3234853 RepID=UPI003BA2C417